MHITMSDGVRLFVREVGSGEQTVVMSHSFLSDHRHYEAQIKALAPHFRVVAYDHRGHGQSDKPRAPYGLQRLVDDGYEVVNHFDASPCHWVGLSTGGFVGMRLAHRYPDLIRRLVLLDTSADPEPAAARRKYRAMFWAMRVLGWRVVIKSVMGIMFGESFAQDAARAEEFDTWKARFTDLSDIAALWAFAEAIFGREDFLGKLAELAVPTLVAVGDEDLATPPFRAERIAARIPGAELEIIPRAGHLSTVANAPAVSALLLRFLTGK